MPDNGGWVKICLGAVFKSPQVFFLNLDLLFISYA
jgi:hypothetical protein